MSRSKISLQSPLLLSCILISVIILIILQNTSVSESPASLSPPLHTHTPHPHTPPSPPPLPSIRITGDQEKHANHIRKFYGGKGDKLHLGGFTQYDRMGVSNNTWNYMMGPLAVKSLIDVGCGRGISSSYFLSYGADVLCIEGSHDAVEHSLLPLNHIIEHDYTRGPWWPDRTYDAVWCVEFLEHVGRQYMSNYMATFKQAALLFVTASNNGGWHHVEAREAWWWKARLTAAGFIYSEDLTERVRNSAAATCVQALGLRIVKRMMVFINPAVASLQQHDHLFGGHGCKFNDEWGVPCDSRFRWASEVDSVPPRYQSLLECSFEPLPSDTDPAPPSLGVYNCTRNNQI